MAKFKDFLEKHKYFRSLSTTFGIVASIGLILMSPNENKQDVEEVRQARMLSDYDRNYITLRPMEWKGTENRHYFSDIPWDHYTGFSNRFCQQIVPLVTLQQSEFPQTYTVSRSDAEIEAKERITQYSGYITRHPQGIEVVNAQLQNMMENGFLYNQAFSLSSTFSCKVGEGLKNFMVGNQSFSFEKLEQSLLQSFNNVLATIEQSRDFTSNQDYGVVMDRAFNAEFQRLNLEEGKQKQDVFIPSFAFKL